jgi:glycine cleavage system H protein
MIPHDILTLYSAKMIEYGIAILFLLLFIPFWKYVQGPSAAVVPVVARVRQPAVATADWFPIPLDRLFHRGHAWARPEADGLVTVGLDGFAAKLVGPLAAVALPQIGGTVGQGERAWRLVADDGRAVEMLSPVDGTIAEINAELARTPEAAQADPYGRGWLFRVRPQRLRANTTSLLSGTTAKRWMEEAVAGLQRTLSRASAPWPRTAACPLPAWQD